MDALFRPLAAAFVVALISLPAAAQDPQPEQRQPAAAARPARQAVPRAERPARADAPRAESPRAVSGRTDASRGESSRAESSRGESPRTERSADRVRGTDDQGRMRSPIGRRSDDQERRPAPVERAVPSAPPVAPAPAPTPEVRRDAAPSPSTSTSSASGDEEQRRAQARGSRPRGGNPTTGRAVPRDGRFDGHRGGDRGRTIIVPRTRVITRGRGFNNYYYYYPRRLYPYGYGAFGLGYFYYDPYSLYAYDPYYGSRYYGSGYYGAPGYYGSNSGYYTGELRLDVEPKHAEVYVDGYFAGHVDDFDGIFQSLRLEDGSYRIEIVAPGYEPLEVDIRIQPGRKITYRGDLRRIP